MTQTTSPIAGPMPHTPEWYAIRMYNPDRERKVVFGASEAAAACNVSPYSSALQLYLEKRGEMPVIERDAASVKRMRMGQRLEPIILDMYQEDRGVPLERNLPMYFHNRHVFMAATPDGMAPACAVDAKATNSRMFDESGEDTRKFGVAGTDQVPLDYMMQAQVQMAVMGVDVCEFPVLSDGRDLRIYTVHRNDELIEQIVSAEQELFERIVNGNPPEPNFSHEGTSKILNRMYHCEVGKAVLLDDEIQQLWERKDLLSKMAKRIEEEMEDIKSRVYFALGDAEVGQLPDAAYEIKRTVVFDSFWTEEDIREAQNKLGQVKRRGHSRLGSRKITTKRRK